MRVDAVFCGRRCRQWAFRLNQRHRIEQHNSKPLRVAYADPPYPGKAYLYKAEASFAGEVDHRALIDLLTVQYDGWALSTSAAALKRVLAMCPDGVRVGPWVKPGGVSSKTIGAHNAWEPLIVMPARELRPGFPDFISTHPARNGGDLIGRKPIAFVAWMFKMLGALPGDTLVDLYPGTGIVARCWRELSALPAGDALGSSTSDALLPAPGDASPRARRDTLSPSPGDASTCSRDDASPAAESDT